MSNVGKPEAEVSFAQLTPAEAFAQDKHSDPKSKWSNQELDSTNGRALSAVKDLEDEGESCIAE